MRDAKMPAKAQMVAEPFLNELTFTGTLAEVRAEIEDLAKKHGEDIWIDTCTTGHDGVDITTGRFRLETPEEVRNRLEHARAADERRKETAAREAAREEKIKQYRNLKRELGF